MKPGTFTELGKLLLNAGLAVFIAAIIQPLVTVTNPPKLTMALFLVVYLE